MCDWYFSKSFIFLFMCQLLGKMDSGKNDNVYPSTHILKIEKECLRPRKLRGKQFHFREEITSLGKKIKGGHSGTVLVENYFQG